jgi:hypothetical protein
MRISISYETPRNVEASQSPPPRPRHDLMHLNKPTPIQNHEPTNTHLLHVSASIFPTIPADELPPMPKPPICACNFFILSSSFA